MQYWRLFFVFLFFISSMSSTSFPLDIPGSTVMSISIPEAIFKALKQLYSSVGNWPNIKCPGATGLVKSTEGKVNVRMRRKELSWDSIKVRTWLSLDKGGGRNQKLTWAGLIGPWSSSIIPWCCEKYLHTIIYIFFFCGAIVCGAPWIHCSFLNEFYIMGSLLPRMFFVSATHWLWVSIA